MNNPQAIPPPPRPAAGCLGIGCMTFVAFFVFLVIAFVAGGFWALQQVRRTYSSDQPLAIPQVEAAASSEPVSSTPAAPAGSPTEGVPTLTGPVPQRWEAFQRAARRGEKVRIEMTAGDINALIASDPNTRGKGFVRIEDNIGRVTVSIPLDAIAFMGGRYVNGEATVRASPDGDPAKAEISNIRVGNEAVPDNFLDRRIFGWSSLRGYINQWLQDENIATFRIENDRAIGETR